MNLPKIDSKYHSWIFGGIVAIIILLIVFSRRLKERPKLEVVTGSYTDPYSGQTVTTQYNPEPLIRKLGDALEGNYLFSWLGLTTGIFSEDARSEALNELAAIPHDVYVISVLKGYQEVYKINLLERIKDESFVAGFAKGKAIKRIEEAKRNLEYHG